MGPQLNSTWSLKSLNLGMETSSEPDPFLTRVVPSTLQTPAWLGSANLQPERSLPLNKWTGAPHWGAFFRERAGALSPIHCKETPLGLVAVPASCPSLSFPLNSVPSSKPS